MTVVKRIGAVLIDTILAGFLAFWAVGYLVASQTGDLTSSGFQMEGGPALLTMAFMGALYIGYFTILEAWFGRTIGKRLFGGQVVSDDGSPIGFGASLKRNVLRIVDGIGFYVVGLIAIAQSDERKRLGDMAADTTVIERPRNKGG